MKQDANNQTSNQNQKLAKKTGEIAANSQPSQATQHSLTNKSRSLVAKILLKLKGAGNFLPSWLPKPLKIIFGLAINLLLLSGLLFLIYSTATLISLILFPSKFKISSSNEGPLVYYIHGSHAIPLLFSCVLIFLVRKTFFLRRLIDKFILKIKFFKKLSPSFWYHTTAVAILILLYLGAIVGLTAFGGLKTNYTQKTAWPPPSSVPPPSRLSKPNLAFFSKNHYHNRLIALSFFEEPKVNLRAYNVGDKEINFLLYEADINDVLNYFVYQQKTEEGFSEAIAYQIDLDKNQSWLSGVAESMTRKWISVFLLRSRGSIF